MSEQPASAETEPNESATDETSTAQATENRTTEQPAPESEAQDQPDWKAEAEKWKKLARKHEERSKSNDTANQTAKQQLAAIAKALGMENDEAPDPEKLKATLAEREQLLQEIQVEQAVKSGIDRAKADPDLAAILYYEGKFENLDPSDDDLDQKIDGIVQQGLKDKPRYRSGAAFPDLKQGNQGQSSGNADPNAWLRQMAGRQ